MLKIHGVPLSPFVRKTLYVLEHKGIDYELVPVFPASDDPGFRAMSPLGKIPALEHDGITISDSSVICRYLDQVFPEKSIYPEDPALQARACWIEEYADSKLVETIGPIFRNRWLNPKMGQDCDEALVENIINNDLPAVMDYVESIAPASGPFVADQMSIADVSVVTCFIQAEYGEYYVSADSHPKLRAYLDRAFASDIVKNRRVSEAAAVKKTFSA